MKHLAPISGIAASPNQEWVATAGYDNRVIIWQAKSKEAVAVGFHDHLANQAHFSSDGQYLVTSGSDRTARVWTVPDLKLCCVLSDHQDDVEMSTFSHSGKDIATASRDGFVRIFSALSGQLKKILVGHESDVLSVQWTVDDRNLVTSGDDGTVRIWNPDTGELVKTLSFDGVETDTLVVGKDILFAGNDEGAIVPILNGVPLSPYRAHQSGVKRLILDQASGFLISLSYDRTLQILLWNPSQQTFDVIGSTIFPSIIWPRSGAMLNSHSLALATFGSTYGVYDLKTGIWNLERIEPSQSMNSVVATQNGVISIGDAGIARCDGHRLRSTGSLCNFLIDIGSTVVSGGQMGALFDLMSGDMIYQHRSPLNCGVTWVVEEAQAQLILIGSYTGEALLFEKTMSHPFRFVQSINLHSNAIKSMAFNSGVIMSVSATGEAVFVDSETFTVQKRDRHAHSRIANGCASIQGYGFASVSRDLKLRLWNREGICLVDVLSPQKYSLKCVAGSSDGKYVAVGSYGGYISIFDIQNATWVSHLRVTTSGISSIQFDHYRSDENSTTFLASSYDGNVYRVRVNSRMVESCAA